MTGRGDVRPRNARLADFWSLTHIVWGVVLTLLVGPWWALLVLVAWEPIEVWLISPLVGRAGVDFGREAWMNSLSDVVFDVVGVAVAWFLVVPAWDPLGVA